MPSVRNSMHVLFITHGSVCVGLARNVPEIDCTCAMKLTVHVPAYGLHVC